MFVHGLAHHSVYHCALYYPHIYNFFFVDSVSISNWLGSLYTLCTDNEHVAEFEELSCCFMVYNLTNLSYYCL